MARTQSARARERVWVKGQQYFSFGVDAAGGVKRNNRDREAELCVERNLNSAHAEVAAKRFSSHVRALLDVCTGGPYLTSNVGPTPYCILRQPEAASVFHVPYFFSSLFLVSEVGYLAWHMFVVDCIGKNERDSCIVAPELPRLRGTRSSWS